MPEVIEASVLASDVAALFRATGLDVDASRVVAESLVDADQMGISSHGVLLVGMYLDRIRAGSVSLVTEPTVVSDRGAAAVLDGRNAIGVLAADHAMSMAVDKAGQHGIACVTVRNGFHFGTARRFAEAAARRNCVGIAMCNTRPLMPAPGGAERLVGNNPIAIAFPSDDTIPLVLDMATSEAAMGKVRMAAARGETIPPNWAVRADGSPTNDPVEAVAGMLLPSAGPKGFGLALMIDLLCGALSGGGLGDEVQPLYGDPAVPYNCSHGFIAIDAAHFGSPDEIRATATRAIARIRGGARAHGVERLFTPGEPEFVRGAEAGGRVILSDAVADQLRAQAQALNVRVGMTL